MYVVVSESEIMRFECPPCEAHYVLPMTYMAKRWAVRQIVPQISGISNLGSRSEYAMSL